MKRLVLFFALVLSAMQLFADNDDVVITSGVEYEIEASGTVRLENGFKVERGALPVKFLTKNLLFTNFYLFLQKK